MAAATVPEPSAPSSPNAFNPAISIILNGSFAHHSFDPESYEIAGFPLAGEAGPGAQGLSLGESEIAFAANIDEKFYGQLTLAIESEDGEDGIGVEEAYIETTALPAGLTARAGRFFSNIGYLNTHHAHTDAFSDRPLAYQALLGNQYADDGVQLRWVAPTDVYLELGGEWMRGQSFPSGGAARSGSGVRSLSAHAGGDIGDESSWLAGVSVLDARTTEGEDGFSGDNRLYIADLTWKWAPNGNTRDGGVTLRSEYLHDRREGRYFALDAGHRGAMGGFARWRLHRRRVASEPAVGYRLPLRPAVAGCLGAIRQRHRPGAPQLDADLAQQRVQSDPPAIQPRRRGAGAARPCAHAAVPDRSRRAWRAQILRNSA